MMIVTGLKRIYFMDLRSSDIPHEGYSLKSAVVTELELSDWLMPYRCSLFFLYLSVKTLINMNKNTLRGVKNFYE